MFEHCQLLGWKYRSFEEKQRRKKQQQIHFYILHIHIFKSSPSLDSLARDRERTFKASFRNSQQRKPNHQTRQENRFSRPVTQGFFTHLIST